LSFQAFRGIVARTLKYCRRKISLENIACDKKFMGLASRQAMEFACPKGKTA
jgi:hypothetical protein